MWEVKFRWKEVLDDWTCKKIKGVRLLSDLLAVDAFLENSFVYLPVTLVAEPEVLYDDCIFVVCDSLVPSCRRPSSPPIPLGGFWLLSECFA